MWIIEAHPSFRPITLNVHLYVRHVHQFVIKIVHSKPMVIQSINDHEIEAVSLVVCVKLRG